jgi:hypothetical protein
MVDNTVQGIRKLAALYDTFIGYGGDYVEMQWDSSTYECELLVLDLEVNLLAPEFYI